MYFIKSMSGNTCVVSALYSGESDIELSTQECFEAVLNGNTILGVFPQQGTVKPIKTLFTEFFSIRGISSRIVGSYLRVFADNRLLGFPDATQNVNGLDIDTTSLRNIQKLVELSGGV